VSLNSGLTFLVLGGLLFLTLESGSARPATGCPPTYASKPLESFEVFDGPPKTGEPQAPEGNRWLFNPIPASLWSRYPPFYLGCKYRGVTDLVAVELPRNIRVCEIRKAPNVQCR